MRKLRDPAGELPQWSLQSETDEQMGQHMVQIVATWSQIETTLSPIGFTYSDFHAGAQEHIIPRWISTEVTIHKGYARHASSHDAIRLSQVKYMRIAPATVTMMPRPRRMQTPIRCLSGICNRMMMGIGRIVVKRSETELSTPAPTSTFPSSRQCPPTGGKVQYASVGLNSEVSLPLRNQSVQYSHAFEDR